MLSNVINESESKINPTILDVTITDPLSDVVFYFIKLKSNTDFFSVMNNVNILDCVNFSFASKGEAEIILIVENASNDKKLEKFETKLFAVEGISSVLSLAASKQYVVSRENDGIRTNAFLIMLVDDLMIDNVAKELLQNKNVKVCYSLHGKYNLIAELCSSSFAENDKFISNYVLAMHGVLKAKELPIINLYE